MNSNTDKKNTPLKGVYTFYSVIIALCILALIVFHLNIYAKAVLCTVIVLCVCIMRSASKAFLLPPDIDPDTMQSIVPVSGSGSATEVADADAEPESLVDTKPVDETTEQTSTIEKGGAIDTYLTLLIEADEELSADPSVDTSSPSYNNLLNHRIGMKLDAMSQGNHPTDKL
jgi:hypothetical protein